ncbi:Bin/amphiphysin/Rvs domain for vesicular trafficking-domain-containing protein [Cokeromyces recurvatus]|uniref:Bin/amphiphysin/Rvs domain for vesicular trafficking-domain-containing protein n=1 Tax=Cokeromyces recurvatus TaxID=90255 RepID=UPI0022205D55|nr:Bin/amphiphysin/Rvs domain for vesicular trafficking-domain-containing protein [Cokeromyces recurvatus]KAI7897794.1 Bin/amphiphysin/Rvs domain for vesicular trafficking-domain-containing protein [Cokeromyces recurvatus]
MSQANNDGIKVIDAEPAPTTNTANSNNAFQGANAILNNTLDSFANLSSRLNPFTQKLNKGLGQVRQFAQEKLGTAENITELPQEYKDLEKRVDALRSVQANLLKISRTFNSSSYDYPIQIQDSLIGISNTVTREIQHLTISSAADRSDVEEQQQQQQQQPNTLLHGLSRVAAQGAESIGIEEPLGTALFKYSTITSKVADARVKMDRTIVEKFNKPMQATLNSSLDQALKARRHVQSIRLTLDACKSRYRSARPEKLEAARLEVEQAEDQFVAAVEEATHLMKTALENPEPFRNLADLVNAQLQYFKEAQELLSDLAPELDEIQVTQESLYRNNHT